VALEQFIAHVKQRAGTQVWWATHAEAAEYVRAQAKLGEPRDR
jgi:hypothetical protein